MITSPVYKMELGEIQDENYSYGGNSSNDIFSCFSLQEVIARGSVRHIRFERK